jgi:hypothetical protein
MTESWTGNPLPLLSYVSVAPPVYVTTTVKDEIEVLAARFELKPKNC